jgi:hypothetical protein
MSYESHKYYNGNLYANIAMDIKNQQHASIEDLKWPYGS